MDGYMNTVNDINKCNRFSKVIVFLFQNGNRCLHVQIQWREFHQFALNDRRPDNILKVFKTKIENQIRKLI